MIDDGILKNYVSRVQLAAQELRDAKKHVDILALQIQMADDHLKRCENAEHVSKRELTEYAATGIRKVYCCQCDQFYVYAPSDGQPEPGCPSCGQASLAQEMLERASEGVNIQEVEQVRKKSAQNWIL